MATYTLTLTEDQAEMLGYALNRAHRHEIEKVDYAATPSRIRKECRERAHKINELRDLLDTCPAT